MRLNEDEEAKNVKTETSRIVIKEVQWEISSELSKELEALCDGKRALAYTM